MYSDFYAAAVDWASKIYDGYYWAHAEFRYVKAIIMLALRKNNIYA